MGQKINETKPYQLVDYVKGITKFLISYTYIWNTINRSHLGSSCGSRFDYCVRAL